eukprot:TRINITY_DN24620_c0_g2_i1.p1 TRINITY_DN24620_c0_g2~~TRINITY_DN24620_c0_g2_i1.p1  ORF type:complete len:323 (+),score=59.75 TRINITY_DN24620_c0_g2_i1:34-1002(+)
MGVVSMPALSQHCFRSHRRHMAKQKQDQLILDLRLKLTAANYEIECMRSSRSSHSHAVDTLLNALQPPHATDDAKDAATQTEEKFVGDVGLQQCLNYMQECSTKVHSHFNATMEAAERKLKQIMKELAEKNAEISTLSQKLDAKASKTPTVEACVQTLPSSPQPFNQMATHTPPTSLSYGFLSGSEVQSLRSTCKRHVAAFAPLAFVSSGTEALNLHQRLTSATDVHAVFQAFGDWLCDQSPILPCSLTRAARRLLLDSISNCVSPGLARRLMLHAPSCVSNTGVGKAAWLWDVLHDVELALQVSDEDDELHSYWLLLQDAG